MEKKDWNDVYKRLSQNWDRLEKVTEKKKKKTKDSHKGYRLGMPTWGYGHFHDNDNYGDLGNTGDFGGGGDGGGDGGGGGE